MINIYSVPHLKSNLTQLHKLFTDTDMLGGVKSRHVLKLEEKLSRPEKKAIAVNHCTTGLKLILERYSPTTVVVPSVIFFGVIGAVIEAGHDYVLAPVDLDGNLDQRVLKDLPPEFIVMNVHMNSRVSDLRNFSHLNIIDDAASAYGGKFADGSDLIYDTPFDAAISFSYGKTLTAGEGGVIFSKDNEEYYKSRRYCGIKNLKGVYGISDFEIDEVATKAPFNAMGAALISLQLEKFQTDMEIRKKNSLNFDQITKFNQTSTCMNGVSLTYFMKFETQPQRDKAREYLGENGIQSYLNHKPVFLYNAFRDCKMLEGTKESSMDYFNKALHIACRSDLTETEIEHIKVHLNGLNEIL